MTGIFRTLTKSGSGNSPDIIACSGMPIHCYTRTFNAHLGLMHIPMVFKVVIWPVVHIQGQSGARSYHSHGHPCGVCTFQTRLPISKIKHVEYDTCPLCAVHGQQMFIWGCCHPHFRQGVALRPVMLSRVNNEQTATTPMWTSKWCMRLSTSVAHVKIRPVGYDACNWVRAGYLR